MPMWPLRPLGSAPSRPAGPWTTSPSRHAHCGRCSPGRTSQVVGSAAVFPQLVEQEAEHGALVFRPVQRPLVVQQHGVGLSAAREGLGVAGDDRADGHAACAEAAQHQAGDGDTDGRLDMRRLVALLGAAVQQQKAAPAGLQGLLQPPDALTRGRRRHRGPAPDAAHRDTRDPLLREEPAPGPRLSLRKAGGARRKRHHRTVITRNVIIVRRMQDKLLQIHSTWKVPNGDKGCVGSDHILFLVHYDFDPRKIVRPHSHHKFSVPDKSVVYHASVFGTAPFRVYAVKLVAVFVANGANPHHGCHVDF